MKHKIISGSNRENSELRKVSNFIKLQLEENSHEVEILDLEEMNLSM